MNVKRKLTMIQKQEKLELSSDSVSSMTESKDLNLSHADEEGPKKVTFEKPDRVNKEIEYNEDELKELAKKYVSKIVSKLIHFPLLFVILTVSSI